MTDELCIAADDLTQLRDSLLKHEVERCAVLYAVHSRRSDGSVRLLVREVVLPDEVDYLSQGVEHAELSPAFVARISKAAKVNGWSLVFVHTHLGRLAPVFSGRDDRGENVLAEFLSRRGAIGPHAALVMSSGGCNARLLGRHKGLSVTSLGTKRIVEYDPELDQAQYSPVFDRQVRAFGTNGQKRLQRLRVAIVGLGGTGSIVAQQLVHLGVRKFILVDPDFVEDTNLNRVVGATRADVGKSKVSVAARYLSNFDPEVSLTSVEGDVVRDTVAHQLIDADIIMSCTDSHGSRSVVQQVAYQYMIPCIDMGSAITQKAQHITGIFGRVQLLSSGLPCLWCCGLLDATQVRRDMMNEAEKRRDPYMPGSQEPAPSVISLNGTVVSLAVTMLLGIVAGAPIDSTHVIYNARASTLRSVRSASQPECFICSKKGVHGWGDMRGLFTRRD